MLIPHRTIPILDKKAFPFIELSFQIKIFPIKFQKVYRFLI